MLIFVLFESWMLQSLKFHGKSDQYIIQKFSICVPWKKNSHTALEGHGWVSDDRMLNFGRTIPLMMVFSVYTYTSFPTALCLWLLYYSGYSCLLWSPHSSPLSASRTWAMHIPTTKPLPVSPPSLLPRIGIFLFPFPFLFASKSS